MTTRLHGSTHNLIADVDRKPCLSVRNVAQHRWQIGFAAKEGSCAVNMYTHVSVRFQYLHKKRDQFGGQSMQANTHTHIYAYVYSHIHAHTHTHTRVHACMHAAAARPGAGPLTQTDTHTQCV